MSSLEDAGRSLKPSHSNPDLSRVDLHETGSEASFRRLVNDELHIVSGVELHIVNLTVR